MDEATFYAQFLLSDRDRARFNRGFLDNGAVPAPLLDHLHTRFCTRVITEHHARIVRECEEFGIERLDLLNRTLASDRLELLADPPGVLFVRGDASVLARRPAVGVVGTRRGTERGQRVARHIGAVLARAGVTVVSGLALGIDGASHVGCLEAGGAALAWLGCGVETVTPPRHRMLYRRIHEQGLLASEYPPGTPVRKPYFVARNRLIAAFSDALVVVEAGQRSGTRSTVDFALELGRDLYCVPGPVDCAHSTGTLRWIREGATMIRGAEDLLEDMGIAPPLVLPAPLGIGPAPESTAQIASRLRMQLGQVAAVLAQAEARGEVRRLAGDRWCAASALPG